MRQFLAAMALAVPLISHGVEVPGTWANGGGSTSLETGRGEVLHWLPSPEENPVPYSQWSGEVALGALTTSGNTTSDSANARARVVNDRLYWRHSLRIEWVYTDVPELPPDEQYRASQKTGYNLTGNDYLFEAIRYDRAESQGVRYRLTEVFGYGRRLYQQNKDFLVLELGAGGRQTRATDDEDEVHEAVGVVQAEFNLQWQEASAFNSYLVVEFGEFNTLTISQTSLTLLIQGDFSARFGYDVTANSDVPENIEKIDRVASATLVYRI